MYYTAIDPYKVFNFTNDYTADELVTKYLLILNDYKPNDNIENSLYNENIYIINEAFISLSLNVNFDNISDDKKEFLVYYLKMFIIKYNTLNNFKNDNYFFTNVRVLYAISQKFNKNEKDHAYTKNQLVKY